MAGGFIPPEDRRLWAGLHNPSLDPGRADVVIVGLPYDGGVSYRPGASEAPHRLRSISRHIPPTTEGGALLDDVALVDLGDISPDRLGQRDYFALVRTRVAPLFGRTFPVFVGGDHSVTIPLVQALSDVHDGPLGLIHLDAHLDLCPELDGNPLSHGCTARRALELPGFDPRRAAFVGIRSFEPEEIHYLRDHPLLVVHAADLSRMGAHKVASLVKKQLAGARGVYLTLDIDVLDPAFAPGTGTPKAGGPGSREVLDLLHHLFDLPLVGMDIVEVAPPLDHSDITAFAAQRLLMEAVGAVAGKGPSPGLRRPGRAAFEPRST